MSWPVEASAEHRPANPVNVTYGQGLRARESVLGCQVVTVWILPDASLAQLCAASQCATLGPMPCLGECVDHD